MQNRSLTSVFLALALTTALSGCGGADPGTAAGGGAGAAPTGAPATAAGEDALPRVRCPARGGAGLPGPDIIGVKLGMTRDDALNVVRCHAPDGHLEMVDRWFDRLQTFQTKLVNQGFSAQIGDSKECTFGSFEAMQRCGRGRRQWDFVAENVTVATPGLPGQQTVAGVWRTQNFRPGEMPAADAVIAALTAKYGEPQWQAERDIPRLPKGRTDIEWVTDTAGTPVRDPNPLFNRCARNVKGRSTEGQSWTDGCGLSITAMLLRSHDNPQMISELSIGMLDQSELYARGERLQSDLQAIEQERQAREVERARSAAPLKL